MRYGLEALQAQVVWVLILLAACVVAVFVIAAAAASAARLARQASAWQQRRKPRPDTTFYVGRFEALRVAVCVVDRDGLRPLFEVSPAPPRWGQVRRPLARALAADALAGRSTRRGLRRLARRLARLPLDGFVLERRTVRTLAGRSVLRCWASGLRGATVRRMPRR